MFEGLIYDSKGIGQKNGCPKNVCSNDGRLDNGITIEFDGRIFFMIAREEEWENEILEDRMMEASNHGIIERMKIRRLVYEMIKNGITDTERINLCLKNGIK